MKKIISMMVVFGLIGSQIACGRKAIKQNISAPIDQVKFEKNYKYKVKLKTGEKTKAVTGDQIQVKSNQLVLNSSKQSKSLMNQDIERVDGVSTKRVGSYTGRGFLIGAGVGAVAAITHLISADDSNPAAIILIPIAILQGGVIGALIGWAFPKHDTIQITPIVSPTAQGGVDAGVNVGVKF